MPQRSIKQYMAHVSDERTRQALQPLIEAILADIADLRALFSGVLRGSDTWNAASIADGDEEAKEVTVTGAALGDFVLVSMGVDVADLAVAAQVTAADAVTVTLLNNTGGAIDLASTTVRVAVIPQAAFVATSLTSAARDLIA